MTYLKARKRRVSVTVAVLAVAALLVSALVAGVARGSSSAKRDAGDNQTAYTGPLKASAKVGPEKKTQWAVVDFDGTFVRGTKAVTGSLHTATGNYIVFFKKNITHCAFVASSGEPGDLFSTTDYATTAIANGTTNGVFVRTLDANGSNVDVSFHLIIACNNS